MNHCTGNITPGKGILFDNIWFSEEWYKVMNNMLSCEGDSVWRSLVPSRAGGSA